MATPTTDTAQTTPTTKTAPAAWVAMVLADYSPADALATAIRATEDEARAAAFAAYVAWAETGGLTEEDAHADLTEGAIWIVVGCL